ncbi:MAG: transcriptional repressor [Bacteroidia bacterium]|nr:transcriptional repressor [Bacteroidia bacterium]
MQPEELLRNKKIRVTEPRVAILKCLMESKGAALSHFMLEEKLINQADRVTIYRTLHHFQEKGLLHKLLAEDGTASYALYAQPEALHTEHCHFHCTSCGQISCLNQVLIPSVSLPEGFEVQSIEFVVKGVCCSCKT